MLNPKSIKIYPPLKEVVFGAIYFLFKMIGIQNRLFYYSKWVTDNGDEKLLLNYPLNSKSTVIDVGGYTGNFSDKILTRYNPHLIILEPVKKYFKILKRKYSNNKNVVLFEFGLSNRSASQRIYLSDDGTSLIKKSGTTEKIKLVNAASFLKKYRHVDLLSINIEGAEYDVLERIIETESIRKIKYLQIQFHSFVPNAEVRRKIIIKNMLKTHKIRFSYPFVWESFKLRG